MKYIVNIDGHATMTKSITENNYKEEISLAMNRLNNAYTARTGQNWSKAYTITTHFEDFDF